MARMLNIGYLRSLDFQHFLIKQLLGHLLHPDIVLPRENARIADIGAGTWYQRSNLPAYGGWTLAHERMQHSIWSIECARQLGPS